MPDCEICGRPDADALCVRCGRVVCDRCFCGSSDLCVDCGPRGAVNASSRGVSSTGLRTIGTLLIVFGMLIASLSFVAGGGESFIIVFPFIFGGVGGWVFAILTVLFFLFFVATSLLPWFLAGRRNHHVFGPARQGRVSREAEAMDYVITIDVPGNLRRTIYIEGDEEAVRLRSRADDSFQRSYRLPEGFELDGYEYEYEGSYLLLRLKLKKEA